MRRASLDAALLTGMSSNSSPFGLSSRSMSLARRKTARQTSKSITAPVVTPWANSFATRYAWTVFLLAPAHDDRVRYCQLCKIDISTHTIGSLLRPPAPRIALASAEPPARSEALELLDAPCYLSFSRRPDHQVVLRRCLNAPDHRPRPPIVLALPNGKSETSPLGELASRANESARCALFDSLSSLRAELTSPRGALRYWIGFRKIFYSSAFLNGGASIQLPKGAYYYLLAPPRA
jgi:hypothetical protein